MPITRTDELKPMSLYFAAIWFLAYLWLGVSPESFTIMGIAVIFWNIGALSAFILEKWKHRAA
jgi:hypothetical protein